MRKLFFALSIVALVSCSGTVCATKNLTPIASLDIQDFDLYTFQLIRKNLKQDTIPVFTNSLSKSDNDLVYEELYLLLEKRGNTAIYLTTFSHKYIYSGGAFNNDFNSQRIFVNESDLVFIGTYDKRRNSITFKNPKHHDLGEIKMVYQEIGEDIELLKVTNSYGNRKIRKNYPLVDLDSIYNVQMIFENDSRQFYFKDDCNQYPVENIMFNYKHLFYVLSNGKSIFYRKRVANKDLELFHSLKNQPCQN